MTSTAEITPAPPLTLIAAVADNGVIGEGNRLIWRLKTDLKRFRALTIGQPLIVGRKTFQSIGQPLPGRHMVVMTRDPGFRADGVNVAHDWPGALQQARALAQAHGSMRIMVGGGAEIYALALPDANLMHLTLVHASPPGDASFPQWNSVEWAETSRKSHVAGPDDDHAFTFVDLFRRRDHNKR